MVSEAVLRAALEDKLMLEYNKQHGKGGRFVGPGGGGGGGTATGGGGVASAQELSKVKVNNPEKHVAEASFKGDTYRYSITQNTSKAKESPKKRTAEEWQKKPGGTGDFKTVGSNAIPTGLDRKMQATVTPKKYANSQRNKDPQEFRVAKATAARQRRRGYGR